MNALLTPIQPPVSFTDSGIIAACIIMAGMLVLILALLYSAARFSSDDPCDGKKRKKLEKKEKEQEALRKRQVATSERPAGEVLPSIHVAPGGVRYLDTVTVPHPQRCRRCRPVEPTLDKMPPQVGAEDLSNVVPDDKHVAFPDPEPPPAVNRAAANVENVVDAELETPRYRITFNITRQDRKR